MNTYGAPEDTVRGLQVGIFRDEYCILLADILREVFDSYQDTVLQVARDTIARAEADVKLNVAFSRAVRGVNDWSLRLRARFESNVVARYRQFMEFYEYVVVLFIQELYGQSMQKIEVHVQLPSLDVFLFSFMQRACNDRAVYTGEYITTMPYHARVLFVQRTLRMTLFELVVQQNAVRSYQEMPLAATAPAQIPGTQPRPASVLPAHEMRSTDVNMNPLHASHYAASPPKVIAVPSTGKSPRGLSPSPVASLVSSPVASPVPSPVNSSVATPTPSLPPSSFVASTMASSIPSSSAVLHSAPVSELPSPVTSVGPVPNNDAVQPITATATSMAALAAVPALFDNGGSNLISASKADDTRAMSPVLAPPPLKAAPNPCSSPTPTTDDTATPALPTHSNRPPPRPSLRFEMAGLFTHKAQALPAPIPLRPSLGRPYDPMTADYQNPPPDAPPHDPLELGDSNRSFGHEVHELLQATTGGGGTHAANFYDSVTPLDSVSHIAARMRQQQQPASSGDGGSGGGMGRASHKTLFMPPTSKPGVAPL
jgi:hypothetical protein